MDLEDRVCMQADAFRIALQKAQDGSEPQDLAAYLMAMGELIDEYFRCNGE